MIHRRTENTAGRLAASRPKVLAMARLCAAKTIARQARSTAARRGLTLPPGDCIALRRIRSKPVRCRAMIVGVATLCLWISLSLCGASTCGSGLSGSTYGLIVSGIGKDPNEHLAREHVVNALRAYLLDKVAVDPNRLTVLIPDGPLSGSSRKLSSAENIERAIGAFARTIGPADRFILYYIGQANAVRDKLRFNLPGPDVTHEDLAAWLRSIRASSQLVILDCPCAAVAAKALAGRGRTILCASNENQAYGTRLGVHFVPALARPESDTNGDGRVSVLEAFTAAARGIEQWYRERQLLPMETPCLEDNGDGVPSERPWRYDRDGGDGRVAAEFFLDRSP